jgi:uncharacterized membrane protein YhhN
MTALIFNMMLVFLVLLLVAEAKKNLILKTISKSIASACFVSFAYLLGINSTYDILIFIGLIFSLVGDILLISVNKKVFLFGLVSFLVAHIFYVFAFLPMYNFSYFWLVALFIPLLLSFLFYKRISYLLSSLKFPVIIYFLVINAMLILALSLFLQNFDSPSSNLGYSVIFVGALLFYLSDMAVAIERFIEKSFFNKLWGLPLYYFGQFLISYSISFF